MNRVPLPPEPDSMAQSSLLSTAMAEGATRHGSEMDDTRERR